MTFEQALFVVMWGLLTKEAPRLQDETRPNTQAYKAVVERMIAVDAKVADGSLVDTQTDRLLIAGIRFYESRFREKPADGDCFQKWTGERTKNAKSHKVCNAVGPMQISKSNLALVPVFPEVRAAFVGIKPWDHMVSVDKVDPWKLHQKAPMTEAELRDPEMNVRLGYAILRHWKVTADEGLPSTETRKTPPGVWMTAFGWGKLPGLDPRTVRSVDFEGRRRCEMVTAMMTQLEELAKKPGAKFTFARPKGWWCGHEKGTMPGGKPLEIALK